MTALLLASLLLRASAAAGDVLPPAPESSGADGPVDEGTSSTAVVSTSEPVVGPLLHPGGPGALQWRLGLGLELEVLPLALAESEFRYLPSLSAIFKLGLPHGFGLDLVSSVLVVDNHLALGASWSFVTGPLTWGLRDLVGTRLGWLGIAAFDALTWGVTNEPGVSVGLAVDESFVTLSCTFTVVLYQQLVLGDWTVSNTAPRWSGVDTGLSVETPVGAGLILYGVDLSYADPDDLLWFAFSDRPGKLLTARFRVAYAF